MQELVPDSFEVVCASDFSVCSDHDAGFGGSLSWDVPLLAGYRHRVPNNKTERR